VIPLAPERREPNGSRCDGRPRGFRFWNQGTDQGLHGREPSAERGTLPVTAIKEVNMASTDVSSESASGTSTALGVDMNLEVVTLPVADVGRAKAFYQSLGWRLDIDLVVSDEVRNVQFTPPHSGCSIQFGKPGSTAEPGSAQKTFVVVKDINAARDDLISRGVNVSEVEVAVPPGFDAQGGRSYFARASFSDPDGNSWVLQEVTTRLPGREWED
jgi:catechol 2,3-dioxygenase-like lactoylglutathione lyase family enzyme